jgi:hypothetical protein
VAKFDKFVKLDGRGTRGTVLVRKWKEGEDGSRLGVSYAIVLLIGICVWCTRRRKKQQLN